LSGVFDAPCLRACSGVRRRPDTGGRQSRDGCVPVMKKAYIISGTILVCVWIGMLGVLVRDTVGTAGVRQFESAFMQDTIRAREEWAGIYLDGGKIGHVHSTIERIEEGYRLTEAMHLDMTVMEVPQKVVTTINAVTDRNLVLSIFSFQLRSGVISFSAYGTVQGTTVTMWVQTAGTRRKKVLELDAPPVLANSIKYYLLQQGLEPGATYTRAFFDPLSMSRRSMTLQVEGLQELAVQGAAETCWKVRIHFSGVTTHAWINAQGETLREESAMGLVMVREDRDTAVQGETGQRTDIVRATSIEPDRRFSKDGLSMLAVRLRHADLQGFTLDGGRQTQQDDVVTVRLETLTDRHTYRLPFGGEGFDGYLAPTPFIQSDHADIRALAQRICSDTQDALPCVARLTGWVYANIGKQPTMSLPSALEVLATRQGDCNEHAVLLAALCRAMGIPARLSAGLVYMNGRFYYHAWNEVYLHAWVSVDATLDQLPADVTHIKFIDGDFQEQIAILRLVGELGIDVLRYQ
jgi:hypothetical protein